MIRFDILTLFPEMFGSPFDSSVLKKAQERGFIEIAVHDIRGYAEDRHRVTDDYPYGGGGGMVMKVDPLARALDDVVPIRKEATVILLTPQGELFNQKMAEALSGCRRLVLICGHYEGVDDRVRTNLVDREISVGDYVLTGGELPAMIVVDAVSRLLPGVLGNSDSAERDSFSAGLLEYPQYTRPAEFRGWKVPEVLLSGHHREIDAWRRKEALKRTASRRPDLLSKANLTEEDKKILKTLKSDQS